MSQSPSLKPLNRIEQALARTRTVSGLERRGKVVQLIGLVIESEGPAAAVGDLCRIITDRNPEGSLAEVVGFRDNRLLLMPLGEIHGISPGSDVVAAGDTLRFPAGDALRGRVIDFMGRPLDDRGPIVADQWLPMRIQPPHPLRRQRINQPFETRIKALDTCIPCGRGQRLGIFAGSGVGKSTLMGMLAGQSESEVNVIALIGERGREVREFIERDLTEAGRKKSVVVVATSNEPALARLRGAFLAMAIAERFRDDGKNVLMMMDSVTRFAMAQREIGLSVGEPPATRGYPPSVFSLLPQLLERAGTNDRGAITGFFTVLVEADDMNDPISDATRSILDGHIVLSRELATSNHYPAIDVLESVSRLTSDLLSPPQKQCLARVRDLMAVYRRNQDLIQIGAYTAGTNPTIDAAIRLREPMQTFLRQMTDVGVPRAESWSQMASLVADIPGAAR